MSEHMYKPDSRVRAPGFDTQLCHLLTLGPWASCFISVSPVSTTQSGDENKTYHMGFVLGVKSVNMYNMPGAACDV